MPRNMVYSESSPLYQCIYRLVRNIPAGRVTTYGHLAREVGTTARVVGFALAALPEASDVPWQRVVNSRGKISSRSDGEGNILQRVLLENEGIKFTSCGRIELREFGWKGTSA